jgi:hypothetical protein
MVKAEPLTMTDEGSGRAVPRGFFSTWVVMADSEEHAWAVALRHARDAVQSITERERGEVTACEVEESEAIEGVVWRRPRGYSFFSEK